MKKLVFLLTSLTLALSSAPTHADPCGACRMPTITLE